MGIFGVGLTDNGAGGAVHQLGDAAASDGDHRLQLLHHDDIVYALLAAQAPAHVLQGAGHILLTIQVIGQIPLAAQALQGVVQHPGGLLAAGQGAALLHEPGALFQGQGVDGDILRLQSQHSIERAAEALKAVPGQPGDEVHVDGLKAHLPGQSVGVQDILGAVAAADGLEHRILQGLGIDGDAADARLPESHQLLPVDGVGAAGLHGIFYAVLHRQVPVDGLQQLGELGSGQGGGGSSPHIQGVDGLARPAQTLAGDGDLPQNALQIGLHQL